MSKPCPFCGASHLRRSGKSNHWTCGTQTGAKSHPSLYWRGEHCREWTKIMTPPPSTEAVEAAKKFLRNDSLTEREVILLSRRAPIWGNDEQKLQYHNAACILCAALEAKEREVEELRKPGGGYYVATLP